MVVFNTAGLFTCKMPDSALSHEDYWLLEEALPELYKLRDLAELAPVILKITSRLIPNIICTYNEMNFLNGTVVAAYHPESMRGPLEALMPELSRSVHEHPIYQHVYRTGEGHPQFISDYLSETEWLNRDFGKTSLLLNVRDTLIFSLQTSNRNWIFIAVSRPQRDFSERDRKVAELLRRHFSAAHDNATAFTDAKAKALIFDRIVDASPHGIILIDYERQVQHINLPASDLLERYFNIKSDWKATLPIELDDWLKEQTASSLATRPPLVLTSGAKRLVIHSTVVEGNRRIILLRESEVQNGPLLLRSLGLTKREAEVLFWTSEAKSNSEIGMILSISPRTVEKHLEVTYRKLKVETRIAAILLANEILALN